MARARAGLTFLEVVVSVAMLAVVAGMLTGMLGFVERTSTALERRADAAEVAHRIIIQHMEDPSVFRGQPNRIELNGILYGFQISEYVLTIDPTTEEGVTVRSLMSANDASLDDRLANKLHYLTVDVYLDDPDIPSNGEILSTLTRIYNPLSSDDTANLIDKILDWKDQDIQKQIDAQKAGGGGGTGAGSGGGTGGR